MKNKSKIGIGIITVGFLISLNPYWLIIAIPIFIIGVVLVYLSNKSKLKKLLWTIIPIVLWYPGMFLFMYLIGNVGTAMAQKIDFIFIEGYEGKAMVISNMECGQKVYKFENREQLEIPQNGVLLYQGEIKSGYINHNYYFENKAGKKTEIPKRANHMYFESSEQKPDKSIIGVWLGGMGTKSINLPKPEIEFKYISLTVSSADSIDKYSEFFYSNNFEELSDSLAQNCKRNKN